MYEPVGTMGVASPWSLMVPSTFFNEWLDNKFFIFYRFYTKKLILYRFSNRFEYLLCPNDTHILVFLEYQTTLKFIQNLAYGRLKYKKNLIVDLCCIINSIKYHWGTIIPKVSIDNTWFGSYTKIALFAIIFKNFKKC